MSDNANEQFIRSAYQVAEVQDLPGWIDCFTEEGTFTDMSIGVTYRGKDVAQPVAAYAKAFPDMHRELYDVYVQGDIVIVELSLNGTHNGPLETATGTIAPTGKTVKVPCCDVFRVRDGKIESFNCYPSGTVMFAQLGILNNLDAATGK
ncbi:nuclear transport factor 2 family protein [Streptomyces sp. VRA16 Mangrove soil]|uniref:nuclear transport factor 2 family protein n=1 Tax=Streptomyces sp. VRA16 Mangrove soil TaxID=2817434 RepID=UPI001AA008A0|nr:nuclear transport factor 2 family protein [Streptomyces sp. VRA16 Mangrove soil]MBO1331229.1 nuclear transport factor 2 family protein [Streptomyces sp. VRA16 Mangrove soil]